LGVEHRVVSAALRRAGLPVPLPAVYRVPRLHDVGWLAAALRSKCVEDVARELGCAPQSVRYAVRKYGMATPVDGRDPPPAAARLTDRAWLLDRRRELTNRELAAELGVSPGRVAAASRRAGTPALRRNGSSPAFPQLYDVEWVRTELATKTRTEIARDLGCSLRSVRDAAARAGVPPTRTTTTR
jgi:hypothetical protein